MTLRSMLARVAALLFSLSLLTAYVVYSHVTPNTAPPDPLGLSTPKPPNSAQAPSNSTIIEVPQAPGKAEFEGFINAGTPLPAPAGDPYEPLFNPDNGLRIIGSKSISQPIFSVRRSPFPNTQWFEEKKKPYVRLDHYGIKLDGGLSQ
jgi:hypothetical protein